MDIYFFEFLTPFFTQSTDHPLKTHRNFLLEGLVVISNEGSYIVIIVFFVEVGNWGSNL